MLPLTDVFNKSNQSQIPEAAALALVPAAAIDKTFKKLLKSLRQSETLNSRKKKVKVAFEQ